MINGNENKVLKLRNYVPIDEKLRENSENISFEPKPFTNPTQQDLDTLEKIAIEEIKKTLGSTEDADDHIIDLADLVPRKPNWDLKRNIEAQFEKLERKTQSSMAALIRKRLQEQSDTTNLADAVNMGAQTEAEGYEED